MLRSGSDKRALWLTLLSLNGCHAGICEQAKRGGSHQARGCKPTGERLQSINQRLAISMPEVAGGDQASEHFQHSARRLQPRPGKKKLFQGKPGLLTTNSPPRSLSLQAAANAEQLTSSKREAMEREILEAYYSAMSRARQHQLAYR